MSKRKQVTASVQLSLFTETSCSRAGSGAAEVSRAEFKGKNAKRNRVKRNSVHAALDASRADDIITAEKEREQP